MKTDKFLNTLNHARFEGTNGLWNRLMLNDPWSVGYVSSLIESRAFNSKEEWESFYYQSGKERDAHIAKLSHGLQNSLNDAQLVLTNKNAVSKMSGHLKNLNYHFGRSKEQIAQKGAILFEHAQKKKIDISHKECAEAVRFRVICQTWNGIIVREKNTIFALKKKFPGIDFISTKGDFDYKYAVDYELKAGGQLLCGIQIKPKSYLGRAPYLTHARIANERKNNTYHERFGKPVFNIISKANGEILNPETLNLIADLLPDRIK